MTKISSKVALARYSRRLEVSLVLVGACRFIAVDPVQAG